MPSGHAVGKTFIAADAVLWFFYSFGPCIIVTTAPTWRQVRTLLWGEVRRQHRQAVEHCERDGYPIPEARLGQASLRYADDWYAVGLSTNEPERFQGYHSPHMLVVFDEAPGVRECVWEAAEGLLTSEHCRVLAIGNPLSPSGPFYDACRSKLWNTIHVPSTESPNVRAGREVFPGLASRQWVEERKQEWGEDSPLYHSRVLGEFPDEGSDTLIPLSQLEAAKRRRPPAGSREQSPAMGVDVARFGDDLTVTTITRAGHVLHAETAQGRDLMQTALRVAALAREREIPGWRIAIDDTGLGGGATDRLRELGVYPIAVNFGGRAVLNPDRFERLKDELWWYGRERFREGTVSNITDVVVEELSGVKVSYSGSAKIRIESKDDIKKRRGRSPDAGESLLLALWAERAGAGEEVDLAGHGRPRGTEHAC